jgi:hypothetical protein
MNQPKRTCYELGVCQQRTPPCRGCVPLHTPIKTPPQVQPKKPRTAWIFEIVFSYKDLIFVSVVVAFAYLAARA